MGQSSTGSGRRSVPLTAPKKQTRTFRDPNRLPLPADKRAPPPFLYAHMDSDWDFVAGLGFLPRLTRYPITPGLNGIDEHGNDAALRAGIMSKGGIIIDRYDDRLLLDGESPDDDSHRFYDYVRYFECEDGRRYHVEPGETPTIGARRNIMWDTEAGSRGYNDFRAHVAAAGIVDPMSDLVFREMEAHQIQAIQKIRERLARNPHLTGRLETAEARLQGMRDAWADLTAEDEAPKPVRVKRAPKNAGAPDA